MFEQFSKVFQAIFKTSGRVKINGVEYTGQRISLVVDNNVVTSYTNFPTVEVLDSVDTIETVSGDVRAHKLVQGRIQTVSGDVNIRSADTVQSIKTVSGDVTIN